MQLPAGAFYLLRPHSLQGERECIYERAVATIRRSSVPFQYVLAVSQVMQKENANGIDDDDIDASAPDESSFLIDEALHFHASRRGDAATFVWNDVQGQPGELLEFVVDGTQCNSVMRSVFEVTYLQCAWERKTGQSHENATDEDLEALKWHPENEPTVRTNQVTKTGAAGAVNAPSATPTSASKSATTTPTTSTSFPSAQERQSTRPPAAESLQSVTGSAEPTIVLTARADLYLYDQASGLFMRQEKNVTAKVAEAGRFLCTYKASETTQRF